MDLGKPQTWLKGVATQAKMFSMYVTSYKLAYSQDQVTWFYYRGDSDNDKVGVKISVFLTWFVLNILLFDSGERDDLN